MATQDQVNKAVAGKLTDLLNEPPASRRVIMSPAFQALSSPENTRLIKQLLDKDVSLRRIAMRISEASGVGVSSKTLTKHLRKLFPTARSRRAPAVPTPSAPAAPSATRKKAPPKGGSTKRKAAGSAKKPGKKKARKS